MKVATLQMWLQRAFLVASIVPGPTQAQGLTTERIYQLCHDRASAEWQQGKLVCPAFNGQVLFSVCGTPVQSASKIADHLLTGRGSPRQGA